LQRDRERDETAAGVSRGGLAWWWTDARRDGGRGLAWWSRVVVAGGETRLRWLDARRDGGGGRRLAWWSQVVGSPEVAERRRNSDDDSATAAVAAAAREAVAVAARSSRCWSGRNFQRVTGICREKWQLRARGRRGSVFEP